MYLNDLKTHHFIFIFLTRRFGRETNAVVPIICVKVTNFDYSVCTKIRPFRAISLIYTHIPLYAAWIRQCLAPTTFSQRFFLVVENTFGITMSQAIPRVF